MNRINPDEARLRASKLELIVMDVDGVLTDGKLYYSASGEMMKRFDVKDGHGIVMARKAGIKLALISGRASEVTAARARELGIEHVYQGCRDKEKTLLELINTLGVTPEATAFIGDDVIDILAMKRVGLSVTVSDAHPKALEIADMVMNNRGGEGAAREFLDFVLESRV